MTCLTIHPFQTHADYVALGFGSKDFDMQRQCYPDRRKFIHEFGFALLTREVVDVLARELKNLKPERRTIDAGSGSGYIAHELKQCGIDVLAVDIRDYRIQTGRGYEIRKVYQLNLVGNAATVLLEKADIAAVLLVWPPRDWPFAFEVADAMRPEQILFYCGESQGGATANAAFFEEVEGDHWQRLSEIEGRLNEAHVQFPDAG